MKPHRKQRLQIIAFVLVGFGVAVALVLLALQKNIDLFYPPEKIVDGTAPIGQRIRAGGMVAAGSVQRGDELDVQFVVTDHKGADFVVHYSGILPDLFREGQGILATGTLGRDGAFTAEQILAKHDENYMPPELADMPQQPTATQPKYGLPQ